MEVASNGPSVLHQNNHHSKVLPPPPRRSVDRLSHRNKSEIAEMENGHLKLASSSLSVDVDVPSSSASEATEPSPALLTLTPPLESDQVKDIAGVSPGSNGLYAKKNRKSNGTEDSLRKSRITRNRDDPTEVVNNYVDVSELKAATPRVVPPIGAIRHPFQMPKMDLEKEKDKLKINMVGPKAKANIETFEFGRRSMSKSKQFPYTILVGPDHQAEFDEDSMDKPNSSAEEVTDRDEPVWFDDRVKLKDKERELDDAWTAIRRQFGGKIGIDAMLHRLMKCNYDIDDMLTSIECELFENLPQPFEELNVGQQNEFERLLRKTQGNPNGKSFRNFQERFMKTYYLGEIVNYYYATKHRGCSHLLYHRCECRDKWIKEFPVVPRYECFNCTKYLWNPMERSYRGNSYCAVCEMYNNRNRRHRVPAAPLIEPEERIAKAWRDLERLKSGTQVTRAEVFQKLEEERIRSTNLRALADEVPLQHGSRNRIIKPSVNELMELSKKFKPTETPLCSNLRPWGQQVNNASKRNFSSKEKLAIIKGFKKCGRHFDSVAKEAGISEVDVSIFYSRFRDQYRLDKINHAVKKELWYAQPSSLPTTAENSNSPTPEPQGRRKRAGSIDDPAFERKEAPPPKTTRRTRQSAAAEFQAEVDYAHAQAALEEQKQESPV